MARLVGMVGIVGIVGMVTMARTLKRAVIRLVSGHGHNSPGLHCEKMDSKLGPRPRHTLHTLHPILLFPIFQLTAEANPAIIIHLDPAEEKFSLSLLSQQGKW